MKVGKLQQCVWMLEMMERHGKELFWGLNGAVLYAKECVMNDEVLHVLND